MCGNRAPQLSRHTNVEQRSNKGEKSSNSKHNTTVNEDSDSVHWLQHPKSFDTTAADTVPAGWQAGTASAEHTSV
jgi:hypothetical protein